MSSLINRIQRAMLGSAGAEKVRVLLAELAIPAGGSGGTMREVRRGFLRPISDEAILRDALANIGLSGGGGGGTQSLTSIRTAILHNLRDSEGTLRDGLDELMAPSDLGGGDGGDRPNWVHVDAAIHIDFLNDRAWTEAEGGVAIDTLMGSDPNTEGSFGESAYDPTRLTGDGYRLESAGVNSVAFIDAALAKILAGSTIRFQQKEGTVASSTNLALVSSSGNAVVQINFGDSGAAAVSSWSGTLSGTIADIYDPTQNALNVLAATITPTRVDFAANGSAALGNSIGENEYPTSGADQIVAALIELDASSAPDTNQALQSIIICDPLPDTTGLSELSAVT